MIQDATSNSTVDETKDTGRDTSGLDFSEVLDVAETSSSRMAWLLTGAAIGMGIMYLIDPNEGRRRRQSLASKSSQYGGKAMNFTSEKARGLKDRVMSRYSGSTEEASASASEPTKREDYLQ